MQDVGMAKWSGQMLKVEKKSRLFCVWRGMSRRDKGTLPDVSGHVLKDCGSRS